MDVTVRGTSEGKVKWCGSVCTCWVMHDNCSPEFVVFLSSLSLLTLHSSASLPCSLHYCFFLLLLHLWLPFHILPNPSMPFLLPLFKSQFLHPPPPPYFLFLRHPSHLTTIRPLITTFTLHFLLWHPSLPPYQLSCSFLPSSFFPPYLHN